MMEQKEGYKSISVDFQQQGLGVMLCVRLVHHDLPNDATWTFHVFDLATKHHVYTGDLAETIELIMLGKLHKETYQDEPETKPTQHFTIPPDPRMEENCIPRAERR